MGGTTVQLGYAWDGDGNRTSVNGITYVYDHMDRLTTLLNAGNNAPLAAVAYAPDGSVGAVGNLWSTNVTGATLTEHDALGRTSKVTQALNGVVSQQVKFDYNPASQIVLRDASNNAYAWSPTHPVERGYGSNGLNQYGSTFGTSAAAYAYDDNGNLTSAAPAADAETRLRYDAENRLVHAEGARSADLQYDPLGRLWRVSGGAAGATRFYYDGDKLVFEMSDGGALRHFYVHGDGVDQPLVWWDFTGANTRRFLHADQQGSIVAVSNGQTGGLVMVGTVPAINSYDPWGVPGQNNMPGLRFGYTGQAWIPELGMYYYKARFYWPMLGRFLQVDPIGYDGGANLYAYVGNDPLNGADPSGLRNCASNDTACVETPESAATPGDPPPVPAETVKVDEIVVTAQRTRRQTDGRGIGFTGKERFYVADDRAFTERAMTTTTLDCGQDPRDRLVRKKKSVGHPAPLGSGELGVHSHPDDHERVPGSGDNNCGGRPTCYMITSEHAFAIDRLHGNTNRVRLLDNGVLTSDERTGLIANMRNWESGRSTNSALSDAQRFCR